MTRLITYSLLLLTLCFASVAGTCDDAYEAQEGYGDCVQSATSWCALDCPYQDAQCQLECMESSTDMCQAELQEEYQFCEWHLGHSNIFCYWDLCPGP